MDLAPIAIVGVSCRFSNAPDPGAFWYNIMRGHVALAPLGADLALPHGASNLFPRHAYPSLAATLGALYACTPGDVTLPRQINSGENADLYFAAQLAVEALADAGIRAHGARPLNGSVRFGYAPVLSAAVLNWFEHAYMVDQTMDILSRYFPTATTEALANVRSRLVDSLPAPDASSFASGLGHRASDWIARECGFDGCASALDAGALSGVVALQAAMDDLRSGRVDVALAGAVMPPFVRPVLEGLSGTVPFVAGREYAPFDAEASGVAPGEGGAFFVLKRRADALAARDRIYALVRSVASGSRDTDCILQTAADRAGIEIPMIGLVEADGRGVAAEDAAEVAALQRLWGPHRPGGPLVGLGSVKGNVGHCFRASAAAGLLKATLALNARVLPPQVVCQRPIESLAQRDSSVYLLTQPRPWIMGTGARPRRAALLSADFTGRRAAVILEQEPEERT